MEDCLCYEENGTCYEIVPTIIIQLKPNSKKCPFYSNDLEKDIDEIKKYGGIHKIILKRKKEKKEGKEI